MELSKLDKEKSTKGKVQLFEKISKIDEAVRREVKDRDGTKITRIKNKKIK